MGLTSAGRIAINSYYGGSVPLTGPSVPLLVWTHIVATYSWSSGERLYVNGTQYGASSGSYTFVSGGTPMVLTLGSSLSGAGGCAASMIQMGQFNGSLDEFQVYARELSASEVQTLANT